MEQLNREDAMENKTFRFINSLYVIMMTNIMAVIYLVLGLLSFSLVPVSFTVIEIMKELIDGEIDGYSGIVKHFNSKIINNIKTYKKEELITGGYTLVLIIAILILKKVNLPFATSLNILFMYIFAMINIYWIFYALINIVEKREYKYLMVLAEMFKNIKKLLTSIVLFIVLIFVGIAMKEFLVLFSFSLYGFLFIKMNLKE